MYSKCTQHGWLQTSSELKRIGNKYSGDAYILEKKNCLDNERPIKRQACVSENVVCVPHMSKMFGTMKNHLVVDVNSNYSIVGGGLGFALRVPIQK